MFGEEDAPSSPSRCDESTCGESRIVSCGNCVRRFFRRSKCASYSARRIQFGIELSSGFRIGSSRCCMLLARKVKSFEEFITRSSVAQRYGLYNKICDFRRLAPSILRSVFPFILFLVVFGSNNVIRLQPHLPELGKSVHLHAINRWEQIVFSCHPHKIISSAWHPILDVFAAIPYLLHYCIPLGFPLYLAYVDRAHEISRFFWLLGLTNWCLYFVWWCFPHAPPWVILNVSRLRQTPDLAARSLEILLDSLKLTDLQFLLAHKEGTAFRRLDERFGVQFFFNLFAGSPVPFACFPSGHVAWSVAMFVIGAPGGRLFFLYVMWISWATMYSFHHYLLDAVAGSLIVFICDKWMKLSADTKFINILCTKPLQQTTVTPPLPLKTFPTVTSLPMTDKCPAATTITPNIITAPSPTISNTTTASTSQMYQRISAFCIEFYPAAKSVYQQHPSSEQGSTVDVDDLLQEMSCDAVSTV